MIVYTHTRLFNGFSIDQETGPKQIKSFCFFFVFKGAICLVSAADDHEEYVPFQGSRHDNFDWQLVKTLFQREKGNVVLSPFSVKVILLLLAEASGTGSDTYKQLEVIYPNIRVPYEGREVHKKILSSLSVSLYKVLLLGSICAFEKLKPTKILKNQILKKR